MLKTLHYLVFQKDKDLSDINLGVINTLLLRSLGLALNYSFIYFISINFGAAVLGNYSLSISLLTICGVFGTFGFDKTILRFAAQYGLNGKVGILKSIYHKMIIASLVISTLLGIGIGIFSNFIAINFFNNDNLTASLKIVGLTIPLLSLSTINSEFFRGIKRIKTYEFFRFASIHMWNILLFFSISLLFEHVISLMPILSYSISLAITVFLSTFALKKKLHAADDSDKIEYNGNQLMKISSSMFLSSFLLIIMDYSSALFIGYYKPISEVGIYNVALRLAALTSIVLTAINSMGATKFTELFWNNKIEELNKVAHYIAKISFWLSGPILVAYIFAPSYFMSIFGIEFINGKSTLVILSIGYFINTLSGSVGFFLLMTGNQHIFRDIVALSSVLNILGNIFLIPKFGINGAALSSVLSMSLWNILSLIFIKRKYSINTFYIPFLPRSFY